MERYHKDLGFPKSHLKRLEELSIKFNITKRFGRTIHAWHRLNERFDYLDILNFLANKVQFDVGNIFEFYVENNTIKKLCYKLPYNESLDLIIVLTNKKDIITLYVNNKNDNHKTLKKELYITK